jgi:hypothetical protein
VYLSNVCRMYSCSLIAICAPHVLLDLEKNLSFKDESRLWRD